MKIYNEHIVLQSQKPREVFNITTQVKAVAEKSGIRDGIIVVSSLHSGTAVIVSESESASLNRFFDWLDEVSPLQGDNRAAIHFPSLLLSHQTIVPVTEARLDLGTNEALLFVELDGLRPRRIALKTIGE